MRLRWLWLLPVAGFTLVVMWAGIGAGLTLLALLAAAIVYIARCAWFPLAACRRCDGSGKFKSRSGKVWRLCPACKGNGSRVRPGRVVWDHIIEAHRAAKKTKP